jgi:transcriptional regulator with XRE-family HTH domain
MNLGKRVKQALDRRGLKQQELADLVSAYGRVLSQPNLSALMKRDSKTSEFLYPLAKALKVNPEWLQDGGGESGLDRPAWQGETELDPDERLLLQHFRVADKTWRSVILRIAAMNSAQRTSLQQNFAIFGGNAITEQQANNSSKIVTKPNSKRGKKG